MTGCHFGCATLLCASFGDRRICWSSFHCRVRQGQRQIGGGARNRRGVFRTHFPAASILRLNRRRSSLGPGGLPCRVMLSCVGTGISSAPSLLTGACRPSWPAPALSSTRGWSRKGEGSGFTSLYSATVLLDWRSSFLSAGLPGLNTARTGQASASVLRETHCSMYLC